MTMAAARGCPEGALRVLDFLFEFLIWLIGFMYPSRLVLGCKPLILLSYLSLSCSKCLVANLQQHLGLSWRGEQPSVIDTF